MYVRARSVDICRLALFGGLSIRDKFRQQGNMRLAACEATRVAP
jgi:hypothetical protein